MKKFYCETLIFDKMTVIRIFFLVFFFPGKDIPVLIISYQFLMNNLILLHNVHLLDICMKIFYCKTIFFDEMTLMRNIGPV